MIFESLVSSGLKRENIEVSDLCTKCSEKSFFSARRGDKQRFCAGIMIKG
jgi:copper oxidase (laccase) domain-containing protein